MFRVFIGKKKQEYCMILNKRGMILSGTVLLLAVLCQACTDVLNLEPQEPSDITVQELIVKMNRATDPKGAYRDSKSYIMKQALSTIKSGTKDMYSTEVKFKAPNKMRTTTFRDNRPTVADIYNNGAAWKVDCITGKSTKVSGMGLSLVEIFTQMANPALDATKIFKKVTLDMSTDKGAKTYRLICDPCKDGIAPYVFYIDGKTFLTTRFETIMYAGGEEYLYVSIPTAYEKFGDIRIPSASTVEIMDVTNISRVTEFEINVDISDSEFMPPVPFTHHIPLEEKKAPAVKAAVKTVEKTSPAAKDVKK